MKPLGKLRIGIIAPPWFAVPPSGYGGIEWVVSHLADGLVERGHDVTLYASGGSVTTARLVTAFDEPPSAALGDPIVEAYHLARAYADPHQFDIIHDHTCLGLVTGRATGVPLVHTVHGQVLPRFAQLYSEMLDVHYVTISHDQAATMPLGTSTTTIYNGVDLAHYPFSEKRGGYLLFVGRMNEEKGILPAIEIARRAEMPLLVLAKVNEAHEKAYYDELVLPALRSVNAEVRLQVPHEEKAAAYAGAYATLFPIQWPEPFGLVMTESMSAGTPVIAFRRGSVPEIIEDGVTGFVCNTVDEAVDAVGRIPTIERHTCCARVEQHFSAALNVERYEALYQTLLENRRPAFALAGPGVASNHRSLGVATAP